GLRKQVQNRIAELRKALADAGDVIVRHGNSYLLRVAPEQVDVVRFRDLTAQARGLAANGDEIGAARLFRQAIGLWRGPALDGLHCDRLRQDIAGLEDARLAALEDCLELELASATGNFGSLTAELRTLVAQYPLRQRLVGGLMKALCYAG